TRCMNLEAAAGFQSAWGVILKYQSGRLRMGVKRFTPKLATVLIGTLLICDYFEALSLKPLRNFVERDLVILAAIFSLLAAALICRVVSKRRENSGGAG
ncbi:hypothetical protein KEJ34_07445, partial [Candidatus Bathyarchaeota archaeon]|nr:hypothetical protein [Candidatus Bathyarchaeota archaeon]